MNDADVPILKKTYELYTTFHDYRRSIPKADRFTVYERSECQIVDVIELLLTAGYAKSAHKIDLLTQASAKLGTLRFFIRLMKDTKVFDLKKYIVLQEKIDEIGRMLGGWIRSQVNK